MKRNVVEWEEAKRWREREVQRGRGEKCAREGDWRERRRVGWRGG